MDDIQHERTQEANDDPTRIYSAAWFERHGVQVLRHDRIITLPVTLHNNNHRGR